MSGDSGSVSLRRTPILERLKWNVRSAKYRMRSWLIRKALNLIVRLHSDSNYIKHVKREVPKWFASGDDDPNRWMADGTVELLAVLSSQGHSGGSIGFAVQFFSAMALFKPWGPLTGAEDEWGEPFDHEGTQQNKRCSHVFRGSDGRAYDGQARVFREPSGACYTSAESRKYIEFPYTPEVEYVDAPAPSESNRDV